MDFKSDCLLLQVTSFEYDFNGLKGVSYRASILAGGLLHNCKTNADFFVKNKDLIEVKGVGVFRVVPLKVSTAKGGQKECSQLELTEFVSKK